MHTSIQNIHFNFFFNTKVCTKLVVLLIKLKKNNATKIFVFNVCVFDIIIVQNVKSDQLLI